MKNATTNRKIKLEINKKTTRTKAKPFLKWAGGKGQLLESFLNYYPEDLKLNKIKFYYEPFVGGGAVFFDIAWRFNVQKAFLYDNNKELILTYRVVQNEVSRLIEYLNDFKIYYAGLDDVKQKEYFYSVRKKFNSQREYIDYNNFSEKWIERAAQIIFLNKTCFNGLFRFNSKGEYNVPAGNYKNPKILDEDNLLKVSELLANAEIKLADFREFEKNIREDSFVYFDPPYRPLSKTSSFTSYSENRFGDKEQIELAHLFYKLNDRGVKVMLSNSDPKNINPNDNFFDDLYKDFQIFRVPAKRIINSDASKRAAIKEIVVTNYPVVK